MSVKRGEYGTASEYEDIKTGDPRENSPTSGSVQYDSQMQKSGVTRSGFKPGSPWWEASRLTTPPSWPLYCHRTLVFLLKVSPFGRHECFVICRVLVMNSVIDYFVHCTSSSINFLSWVAYCSAAIDFFGSGANYPIDFCRTEAAAVAGLDDEQSFDVNCTPPAIDDFPRDLFSERQRQDGALVLHVVASLYLFVALAVVCDKYFVPAVEKICQGERTTCLPGPSSRQYWREPTFFSMERHWNVKAGEAGGTQENPPTSAIVQHDSHMRKSRSEPAGDRVRMAVVGGERASHCTTTAPSVSVTLPVVFVMRLPADTGVYVCFYVSCPTVDTDGSAIMPFEGSAEVPDVTAEETYRTVPMRTGGESSSELAIDLDGNSDGPSAEDVDVAETLTGVVIYCVAALNMSNDVAGATFMAAATSAPELFVNVIGTFITEGDIGVGTIVGSAVFNILAVAACCGIGAGIVVPLDWWPLTRDCLAYGVTVALMICIIHDERVEWYEALILVLLYIVYIAGESSPTTLCGQHVE
ncbi:hypothetical protein PR048_028258 [Dryococelus australis]|uniref:Sodium/calcium exchanger membrane region domain-containing protein n=1 Tax=Dryococelus australis TaxID=614101 RepID=A0ABQ9GIR6_9NEOP|nr:hypothetical protein PR048_028258 [Dryococelus australis]